MSIDGVMRRVSRKLRGTIVDWNPVDRVHWAAAAFGPDGENVVAGATSSGGVLELYVFEASSGRFLSKVSDEETDHADGALTALACHPRSPLIATACAARPVLVKLWASADSRSWRAFAPGFEELHENTRHDEREDEFDVVLAPDPATQRPHRAPAPPPRPSSPVDVQTPRPGLVRPRLADVKFPQVPPPHVPPPRVPPPRRDDAASQSKRLRVGVSL